ncbi:MAG: hypothetical protein HXK68_02110 [Clostridiales bacterium]|nr:hypothetical protein [Clostridiales bacterium]
MDKKIIKIILIILIFILLFFNIETLQRHLISKKINSTNIKIEQFIKNETGIYIGYKDDKYIRGLEEFYKEYNVNISKDELQRVLYNFTNQTLKNMRDILVGKSQEEIKKIYDTQNKNDIKIFSENAYLQIWKEIEQSGFKSNSEIVAQEFVIYETIKQDKYIEVRYKIFLTNNRIMSFIIQIPNDNNSKISISNHNPINQYLKKNYYGSISTEKLNDKIYNFYQSLEQIQKSLNRTSNNKRLEYYYDNKENMKDIGITTQEDFQKILKEIYNINWKDNVKVNEVILTKDDSKKEKNYQNFTMLITTSNKYSMKFTLKLSMTEAIQPNVIISTN